jgi:hypothetical protein
LTAICFSGAVSAIFTMFALLASSPVRSSFSKAVPTAFTSATPPPGRPLGARFGGIPLTRQRTATLTDLKPVMASSKRNELIHRLLAICCEICAARTNVEVHHLRKLADLTKDDERDPNGCT